VEQNLVHLEQRAPLSQMWHINQTTDQRSANTKFIAKKGWSTQTIPEDH